MEKEVKVERDKDEISTLMKKGGKKRKKDLIARLWKISDTERSYDWDKIKHKL